MEETLQEIQKGFSKQAKKSPFHIPSLDGIRAFAFLLVFMGHAGLSRVVPGGFGVTIFFFLSGYLITTLLRREYDSYENLDFKKFYTRRALRIFPPYYLVLLGALALAVLGFSASRIELGPVMAQVLYYTNYWILNYGEQGQAEGTGPYWSLAVEEHFYLIFPLIYLTMRRLKLTGRQQFIVLLGLCGLVLLWRCFLVFSLHTPSSSIYVRTDTRFDSLLYGCALAVYCNPALDENVKRVSKIWKRVLLPIGFIILTFSFVIRDDGFRDTFRYTLQGIGLYPFFMVAILNPNWLFFRAFNWKWFSFIGVLSYSLYLVHEIVILGVRHQLPMYNPLFQGVISFFITLGCSYIIYQTVEKPCARLRKHWQV